MKFRPSLSFAICLGLLLAIGAAGFWVWNKANSVPAWSRSHLSFMEALKFKKTRPKRPASPEEIAERRRKCRDLKAKLVAEFPALKIIEQPVPDEENGFLLLYQFGSSLPLTEEFKQILQSDAPWDPETAKRCLAEHAELVNKIELIAALPTRSSSNMPEDYMGFIGARVGNEASGILLLKAHLASDAGDEAETLRLVAAVGNLGSHYRDIETPFLLSETVAIVIDSNVSRSVFETLLPALGRNTDLSLWEAALGQRTYTDFDKVMRGEWNIGADYMFLPLLLAAERDEELPDAEAVARCYAAMFSQCITELPSRGLADMRKDLLRPGDVSHLSKEGRAIFDVSFFGVQSWGAGYVRAAAVHHQYQAALDLLKLEKSGATLTAADANRVTRDPVSGLPFVFDPASRQLSAPPSTAALNVKPLTFPW